MPDSLENLTSEQIKALSQRSALLDNLLNDPETRKSTLRLLKKKNPNMSLPEIDAEDAASTAIAAERTEREKLEKKVRENEARDSVNAQRSSIVNAGLVTVGEIADLEKFMQDNEIVSYEKAAKLYRAAKQAERASTAPDPSDTTLTMPDDKELWKNPAVFARKAASKAITDLQSQRH